MFSLLSLLDDIATTMDDVAVMSKVAMEKTSALMTDDLAVNAGVIDGVSPSRELPMVKAIFWGSLLNKVYCISGALLLTAFYPPLINWILLVGGLYLSYEGVHKIVEKLFHHKDKTQKKRKALGELEKVKGAVRTDLILSIEIIVIALSTLSGAFWVKVVTLIAVGLAASILIYGLVAVIVKIDDFGLFLVKRGQQRLGMLFVNSMPYTMRGLGILGTTAMLLVGGGIMAHFFHLPHYTNEYLQNLILGLAAGLCLFALIALYDQIKSK